MSNEKNALFTILGGTGDLARRKLYPFLFRLYRKGNLGEYFVMIGTVRRLWSDEHYREVVKETIRALNPSDGEVTIFASHLYYQSHDVNDSTHYQTLKELSDRPGGHCQLNGNRVYYLVMASQLFGTIVSYSKSQNIMTKNGFNRLIIEKPFGSDYQSVLELNQQIGEVLPEQDIFRIDHYLGKEMIQNISAIRFTNNTFKAQWNNRCIDNIQITFGESLGVEDRGGYYDHSGVLRDMVQNHILQVVALLAMEPPVAFSEKEIHTEKIKASKTIRIYNEEEVSENFVRGQYIQDELDGVQFKGYREEDRVDTQSEAETFAAGRFTIDNFCWSGVPFYVYIGKCLTEKGTRINIIFKQVPVNAFKTSVDEPCDDTTLPSNALTIYVQPTEGFSLPLSGKEIGQGSETEPTKLEFRNSAKMVENNPEAYEKLLLDALDGDRANFSHREEVAQSWHIMDAIRKVWDQTQPDPSNYKAGSMGPKAAFELLEKDGFEWIWQPDN